MFGWIAKKDMTCLLGGHHYDVMHLGTGWQQTGRVRCLRCEREWDCLTEVHYDKYANGSIRDTWVTKVAVIHEIKRKD